jgi:hypothetical protein
VRDPFEFTTEKAKEEIRDSKSGSYQIPDPLLEDLLGLLLLVLLTRKVIDQTVNHFPHFDQLINQRAEVRFAGAIRGRAQL